MKMMKKMTAAALAAAVVLAMAGCGGSGDKAPAKSAGGDQAVTLKLAAALPTSHPLVQAMEQLKTKAAEKSGGTITINIYPAGQLFNDKNMNDALISGGIDMGLNTVGRWASIVPAMDVFDVPFLFPSYEKVDQAIDSGLGEKLGAELEKKGVRPLIWADYGFVQFANNGKLITKPEDFQGMKIRGYSKFSSETINALGASSVTMGSSEVYMGIQRGTIDGQTSGTTAMRDRKMYEVLKYMTVTNHASPEFIVAMSQKSYDKLSDNQKKALDEACKEVQQSIRDNAKAEDLKALDDLKAKGMEVYVVPESELPAWQAATRPVWDQFIAETGDLGKELIDICTKQ